MPECGSGDFKAESPGRRWWLPGRQTTRTGAWMDRPTRSTLSARTTAEAMGHGPNFLPCMSIRTPLPCRFQQCRPRRPTRPPGRQTQEGDGQTGASHLVDARHHCKDDRVADGGGLDAGLGQRPRHFMPRVPGRTLRHQHLRTSTGRRRIQADDNGGLDTARHARKRLSPHLPRARFGSRRHGVDAQSARRCKTGKGQMAEHPRSCVPHRTTLSYWSTGEDPMAAESLLLHRTTT
jgi:hypothetical protein